MALELALRVDNLEASVPQLYLSPLTIGKTGPCPTCWNERTTRNGGPEPSKADHHPSGGTPSTGSPGADSAPLGVHESNKGQLYPPTRTGHLPGNLALSLMQQLHDAIGAGAGRQKFQE